MIFDPTDFDAPYEPNTNWLQYMLQGVSSRRRARPTPISHLSPRLLDDIGLSRARIDTALRHRR